MELLLDADGHVVVRNGKPVYKDASGKEIEFDASGTTTTIAKLRTDLGDANKKVTDLTVIADAFKDLDPVAAKKALATVKNLDDKKLVDAGEVETVKQEAIKAVEEKYKPTVERNAELEAELRGEKIGGAFVRSKFIADKLAVPADFIEARFGRNFSLEKGKVVAKDSHGNVIYSKANPGEMAGFDEALELLVDAYPDKARILKGAGSSGGGTPPGGGGGGAGKQTMKRAEFEKLDPVAKAAKATEMNAGKLALTD